MSSEIACYPWYDVVEGEHLEQGDILVGFGIAEPDKNARPGDQRVDGSLTSIDVVIMTQSCDILNEKVKSLILCPVQSLDDFIVGVRRVGRDWSDGMSEKMRQGNLPGYHLIRDSSAEEVTLPISVVNFHDIYTASVARVREFASSIGKRLRLCPPCKEHLAQSFARFFMRVGLPEDIPAESIKRSKK